jgi:glycosyltransferase involved in cell wall biosynthesis
MKKTLAQKNLTRKPLVSIIMPVYNASKFIEEAIDSVLDQTYKNWELIAVDDGSKDNSLEILQNYAKKHKNIKVFKNKKNLGVGKTTNFALSKAKGRFIARFDSDDYMPSYRIEKQVNYLLTHKNTIVVGGQVELMNEQGFKTGMKNFPLSHKAIHDGLFTFMTVQQGSMMVNKSKLPNGFVWYNDNAVTAEEVDLFFRLFKYGNFANLKVSTLRYRQYSSSTSLSQPKLTFYNTYRTRELAVKFYGYKPTTKAKILNLAQYLVVSILPTSFIYPVFAIIRGLGSVTKILGLDNKRVLLNFLKRYNLANAK